MNDVEGSKVDAQFVLVHLHILFLSDSVMLSFDVSDLVKREWGSPSDGVCLCQPHESDYECLSASKGACSSEARKQVDEEAKYDVDANDIGLIRSFKRRRKSFS